ncbi:MAG: MerR family transcriptional regulator [Bacteroidales bacterium]|nr:MerR family transcriptional regulator [Bacteroidales bacterium]
MSDSKLYYSIGEVAKQLGVNTSKLRFWEKAVPLVRPTKNQKGVRFYTSQDIEVLKRIQYLTDSCGFTLEGATDQIKNDRVSDDRMRIVENLTQVREFLVKLKEEL